MIGRSLGHYDVVEKIGEGGMGAVYRARDTKLGREVALKLLPELLSGDTEKIARLEREARLLASLSHPNIATLHGLEESNGLKFLVMELVPGRTLAELISRRSLNIDECLGIFRQIAEGLEAAHEKGIIHRDLKPANIVVTSDGKVKVLDFGLAKAIADETPSSDLSKSPTLARERTEHGVILGTVSYMSPEQARGLSVDRRADIWAFGCSLYEALTGTKAFEGNTSTDVLAAVVKSEPDFRRLPKEVPWRVRDLLGRCLRKDPAKRLRDISAARLDIEDGSPAPAEPTRLGWRPALLLGAVALILGLLLGALVWRGNPPRPPRTQRFAVQVPIDVSMPQNMAVSPDGTVLAFGGRGSQLGIRRFDEWETLLFEGTGAVVPFFSPDGEWVGFRSGNELKKVYLAGGPPVTVARVLASFGATWSVDGYIYLADQTANLQRVRDSGGTPEVVVANTEASFRWPHALPDGRHILVMAIGGGAVNVEAVTAATGERKLLLEGASSPSYVPTGHILFGRAGALFAAPFDLDRLEVVGEAVPVVKDVRSRGPVSLDYGVSPSGALVYKPAEGPRNRLVWVDRRGKSTPLRESDRGTTFYPHSRLSPDDRRVAVTTYDNSGLDVRVLDIARGILGRIGPEGSQNVRPIWSPDGKELIFGSSRGGAFDIFSAPADGRGPARQITRGTYRIPSSISSDGRIVLFRQAGQGWDIGMVRLDEKDSKPETLLATRFNEHTGVLSPDDRFLAYVSDESGRTEVYVASFPDLGQKQQVSTDGGFEPLWSRDGKELYYRNGDKLLTTAIQTKPDLIIGQPLVLFAGPYELGGDNPSSNYDVTADGRFLMVESAQGDALPTVNVVLNWFEELKARVPTPKR